MSVGAAGKWAQKQKLHWVWPLDLAQYDQRPTLKEEERTAIGILLEGPRRKEFAREPWKTRLSRLLAPILDALEFTGATRPIRGTVVGILLREMQRRDSSLWSWREQAWEGMLRTSMATYSRVHGVRADTRPHLM